MIKCKGSLCQRNAVLSGDGILHGFHRARVVCMSSAAAWKDGFPTSRLPICCLPFHPVHHFQFVRFSKVRSLFLTAGGFGLLRLLSAAFVFDDDEADKAGSNQSPR